MSEIKKHDRLYGKALEAIGKLHADKSVSKDSMLLSLKSLREDLDAWIDDVQKNLDKERAKK